MARADALVASELAQGTEHALTTATARVLFAVRLLHAIEDVDDPAVYAQVARLHALSADLMDGLDGLSRSFDHLEADLIDFATRSSKD